MPRTPTSLQAQAEERANQDHSRRLAEIKAMAPLLARLDAFVPALKDHGLQVYADGLHLHTEHRDGRAQKVLHVEIGTLFDFHRPTRWLHALQAMGFTEVRRSEGPCPQAVLRHGHLLLKIDAPESAAQRATAAAAYAKRTADALVAETGAPA